MRPKDAANLDFWEEWLLIEGYERRASEAEDDGRYEPPEYDAYARPRRRPPGRINPTTPHSTTIPAQPTRWQALKNS